MGGGQCISDPNADASDLLFTWLGVRIEPLSQGPAGAQFHDQIGAVVGKYTGVVDRHDARVI